MQRLEQLIAATGSCGGALLISGEPGIGKSALLSYAAENAKQRGLRLLRAVGVQSETRIAFAGLHQLLHPVLADVDALHPPQRDALRAAFGTIDAAAPDLFHTALAALDLLSETASKIPLLATVEDLHWVDRSSVEVLAFVARRLEYEPILLLATMRDGFESPLDQAAIPVLHLAGLNPVAAGELVDATAPELGETERGRVLDEAAGNPLALLELPIALREPNAAVPMPGRLPLTTKLEQSFASRVLDLPMVTRTALLVAALDDSSSASEVVEATAALTGGAVSSDDLIAAVSAGLIELAGDQIAFRHSLLRAAIRQQASLSQRQAASAALADALARDPDRQVWHRAASIFGSSEPVAAELEAAAHAAERRGAGAVAIDALETAARLSPDPERRGQRLLRAAELGFEIGQRDVVGRLLADAEQLALAPADLASAQWMRGVFDGQRAGGAGRLTALLASAEDLVRQGESDLALKILWSAAIQCWWSDAGPTVATRIVELARDVPAADGDLRLAPVLAFACPRDLGREVIDRLARGRKATTDDADGARVAGTALNVVGAFDVAAPMLALATAGLRVQGKLGLLARALTQEAWSAAGRGDVLAAVPIADEAARLTLETTQPTIHFTARAVQTILAAMRGDEQLASEHAAATEQFGFARSSRALLAMVQHARGLAALAGGRHQEAYEHLRRVHDAGDQSFHSFMRLLNVADLADAASGAGRGDEALREINDLEAIAAQTSVPLLTAELGLARALLADGHDAEATFDASEKVTAGWPFLRSRVQLARGEWLHRQRRRAESRAPLRAARDTFDALGAIPWGERARRQLRASGETSRKRGLDAAGQLTPQELQIAQLAAKGMTNREIGQMLYLSHRTISSHLYAIFPKLGVSARVELRDVLEPSGAVDP